MPLFCCRARRAVFSLLGATVIVCCAPRVWAQRAFNVVNDRFATVSSGPQSSLVVDAPPGVSAGEVNRLVAGRARADWEARGRSLQAQLEQARRAGVVGRQTVVPVTTLVTVRQQGQLVLPAATTRQVGGGTLTFNYVGWDASSERFLRDFQTAAYPLIQNLYGAPAWTGTVDVVNAGTFDAGQLTQVQRLAFGAYDVSTRRILLPIYQNADNSINFDSVRHAFLLLLVHAFHGPTYFQYDAWEQGFARAAASILARDPALPFERRDGSANNLLSLLKFYDLLNQPALGNPTFFPPSQKDVNLSVATFSLGKMFLPRLALSGAAWLKVYIENPAFFRQFNAAYYAQFNPAAQPSLAGNVPALRALAATAVGQGRTDDTVEGLPFNQWYERQYVLDTSVAVGNKLFAFVNPTDPEEDSRQSSLTVLVYFRTRPSGDEDLLAGRAYATYFDAANAPVRLGNESEQTTITEGEGFLTTLAFPTPGFDAGRVTMDFHVGNETARAYLPSGLNGDFQVLVLGKSEGRVAVRQTTIGAQQTRTGTATLESGGAGVNLGTGDNDLAVTVVEVTIDNVTTAHRFNTGDGRYYALVRVGGGVQTVTRAFAAGPIPTLVSFPVRPLRTDVAQALGVAPTDFLLSYWDPTRPGYQTFASGPSGPSVAPLQTGRAYWLKAAPISGASQLVVNVTGVAPPRDTDITVSLPFGWNLIGTPWDQPVNINDPQRPLQVQYLQNDVLSWGEAVTRNLVAAQPFGWAPDTGYGQTDTLQPWQGYWVRVLDPNGVTLIIPGPDAPTRTRSAATRVASPIPTTRPDWSIRVHARATGMPVARATLGAARGAQSGFDNRWDREAPPAITPGLALEFPHPDWGKAGGRYVADLRDPTSANRTTWDVNVASPSEGDVTLFWDGLGTVPRKTHLTLVDTVGGTRTALRGRSSYTFKAQAGQSRALQIVAEPERSLPLTISSISVARTRGVGGLTIGYAVSEAADMTLEVRALGGKSVRRLRGGRAESLSRRTVSWDGRGDDGAAVPAGPYTVTITARSDDGTLARQIRPILVLR